jgi:FkbM family methyltransferase
MGRKTILAKLPDGTAFHGINAMEMQFCYREIFVSGAYDHPLIEFHDGDTILDVGANIGLFLKYVAERCAAATIFAFEPIPRIFRALSENARSIEGHDIRLECCGLSDREGEATFTFLKNVTARSTMYPEYSPADSSEESQDREMGFMLQTFRELPNAPMRRTIAALPPILRRGLARAAVKLHGRQRQVTCPLKTLSRVIDEQALSQVDLVKIDVEGAERDVLRGIGEKHWPMIRQLIVETHPGPGDVCAEVRETLESRGFEVAVSDQTLHPAPTIFARRNSF